MLSWPNPTAEKVFFLTNKDPTHHASTETKLSDSTDSGTTAGDTERDTTDSRPQTESSVPKKEVGIGI